MTNDDRQRGQPCSGPPSPDSDSRAAAEQLASRLDEVGRVLNEAVQRTADGVRVLMRVPAATAGDDGQRADEAPRPAEEHLARRRAA